MNTEMLDYREAATLLGIKVGTLYSLVSRRQVPFVRLGNRLIRFPRPTLEAWIEARLVAPKDGSAGGFRNAK